MRATFRYLVSLVALIFGAGTLSPLIQANWQEWAKATGNDQYFVKYGELVVIKVIELAQSSWFIFTAGFFVGGTVFLWLDYFLLRKPQQSPNKPASLSAASSLAHGLHMPSNTGMNVIVDVRKKVIQIGFNLRNSSDIPLRFVVENISAIIEGKTIMNARSVNRGGFVAKGDTATHFFAPIPYTIGKKDVQAEASIVYTYGPAAPDEPQLREANYRVSLTISPKYHSYLILEENDGEI